MPRSSSARPFELLSKYGDPSEEGFDDTRQALVAVLVKQGKIEDARKYEKQGDKPLPAPAAPPLRPASSAGAAPLPCRPGDLWYLCRDTVKEAQ